MEEDLVMSQKVISVSARVHRLPKWTGRPSTPARSEGETTKIATLDDYQNVALRNGEKTMRSQTVRRKNMLKRNPMRFAAALLAALASFVTVPNAALAAEPQRHDQVPGFYRLKVGDLEVTALFDGAAVADPEWFTGTKATVDGVAKALHEDPRKLQVG